MPDGTGAVENTGRETMSEAKHTPGPWDFDGRVPKHTGKTDKGVPFAWINLDAPGHLGGMRITTHASMSVEEVEANARLTAAAPDLLRATQDASDFIDRNLKFGEMDAECKVDLTEALKRINAAIQKATGS